MGVKIIAGRAKSGKSTYIYDDIKKELSLNNADNLILIVPEQMTYQSEYEAINSFENSGIMELEILSFKRLSYKILEEVGGLKVQEINDYGKIMMLKQIFEENIDELMMFKKASKQDGFLKKFEELIKEFKQNSISIEFLENIVKYKIDDEVLKRKLNDIIMIYREIINRTENKFYDDEDKTDLFISCLEKSNFIRNSKIWIDGFDSFYGQRFEIIKKLVKYSKEVSISLTLDAKCFKDLKSVSDWEAFKITYDTYDMLSKEFEDQLSIVNVNQETNMNPQLRWIEKNILSLETEKFIGKTDNIYIYSSMNQYTETEKAAAKIVTLVRDYNFRWKDIKIVVGDMDLYSINIIKIFAQYEIPYFLDVKRDIMDNPLTKYILSLLDMFIWNFKYDHVFEYLKTGFSALDYDETSRMENFALRYGIEGNRWFKDFKFKAENIDYYNGLRKKLSDDFSAARKEFQKLDTALDITLFLFDFIKKHKVQDKIEKQVEIFKQFGMYEKSSENAQVWNYVINIFDQITLAGATLKMNPKEYRKMIESGFGEIKISIIPPTIDKIIVADKDKISLGVSKVLFVLGANEGKLDSKNYQAGLLLDDEREVLSKTGMRMIKGSSYDLYKEKHTLYRLFSVASERMYVSYALGTSDGKSLQPSYYVDKIKSIFDEIDEETDFSNLNLDELNFVSNRKGTIDNLVSKIRDYVEGKNIDDVWKNVYSWYEVNDASTLNLILDGIYYDNKAEKIDREYICEIFKNPVSMSVSKLESYAECPFKFFVENVIQPQPRYIQKIEFYDLGNIYHQTAEKFTNEIFINNLDISSMTRDEIVALSEKCTDIVLSERQMELTALDANERNQYMKEKIKRLVNRAAFTIVEQLKRGSFRPGYTELEVRKILELSDGHEILLKGRIDRVDIMKNDDNSYVNIIDYKSSYKDIDLSDAVQGLQLQLLVYMSSLMEAGEKLVEPKPQIGGVYYFCMDDPLIDGDKLSDKCAEDEIFSKLSLKGYVVEDMEVIRNMDNKLEETKISDIIPVSFNKDGSTKKTSKTLTKVEFNSILNKAEDVSRKISEDILDGIIDIKPYKKDASSGDTTPCTFCDYNSICKFDTSVGNKHRKILKQSKNDILLGIMNESGGTDDEMDR